MTQKFKGDETELKFEAAATPILASISTALDEFYDGAYDCEQLGAVLWDDNRSPLTNAIKKSVYVTAFNTIFDAFQRVGSFQAYLDVFTRIFGDDVDVQFTVPAPGKLEIDITSSTINTYNLKSRHIVDDSYLFDQLVTTDGENIVAEVLKGFQTQQEVEAMLFEMVPAGVYTTVSLAFI